MPMAALPPGSTMLCPRSTASSGATRISLVVAANDGDVAAAQLPAALSPGIAAQASSKSASSEMSAVIRPFHSGRPFR